MENLNCVRFSVIPTTIFMNKYMFVDLVGQSRSSAFSNVVVVPEASSRYGDHFNLVTADHNSICQPTSRIDRRFFQLENLIYTVGIDLTVSCIYSHSPRVF